MNLAVFRWRYLYSTSESWLGVRRRKLQRFGTYAFTVELRYRSAGLKTISWFVLIMAGPTVRTALACGFPRCRPDTQFLPKPALPLSSRRMSVTAWCGCV